jgi:signal transduction histidine kinase
MPGFDARQALGIVREHDPLIPFLIVSGKIGQQAAIEAMKAGVSEYLMKGDTPRLGAAMEKALEHARAERSNHLTKQALRNREEHLRAITSHIPGMVFRLGLAGEEPWFLYVSDGTEALLHCAASDVRASPESFFGRIHPEDRPFLDVALENCVRDQRALNWTGRLAIGEEIKWINLRGTPGEGDGRPVIDGVVLNVTQSVEDARELQRSHHELQTLSDRLHDVRETEREEIAREIHDELGSMLTAIRMDLYTSGRRLERLCPESEDARALATHCSAISQRVDAAIETVRRIARSLRPPVLDDLGLRSALEWFSDEFGPRAGLEIELDLDPDLPEPDRTRQISLFRIAQEALTNAARHSGGDRVKLGLHGNDDGWRLSIEDNGRGMRLDEVDPTLSSGLLSMRERARRCHGTLAIIPGQSGQSGGTRIEATLPRNEVDHVDDPAGGRPHHPA